MGVDLWDVSDEVAGGRRCSQLALPLKVISKIVESGERESVGELTMTFVLPGDDNIELVKGGCNKDVTFESLSSELHITFCLVVFSNKWKLFYV